MTGTASKRVLMVDDDALIAMTAVDMLEEMGHRAVEANSGEEALELLEAGQVFDLLITDYSMPRMSGVELGQLARRLQPNLAILVATGYDRLPDGSDASLILLSKPYTQEQLAEGISRAVNENQPACRTSTIL
jgi:CheY-like chemotaxis protein